MAASCCWSPIIVPVHADSSQPLSTSIPASEMQYLFELQHNKRRSAFTCSRLAKQPPRQAAAPPFPPREPCSSCSQCGPESLWVQPTRGSHGDSFDGSVGLPVGDWCTAYAHVEAHWCGSARAWTVVTQACLLSCRSICVHREEKCLLCYKAMGRNFSPPTRGSCTQAYGHPPWYEECRYMGFSPRNSKRFKNGAARKFRRSGVSQSERFVTGGHPPKGQGGATSRCESCLISSLISHPTHESLCLSSCCLCSPHARTPFCC